MTTDVTKTDTDSASNPFASFAKLFSALAEFFGNPEVQRAGRKLFAELDNYDDDTPRFSPPVDLLQLSAGRRAPCPHCESDDVDRGATGLDQCNKCGGLSRDGRPLERTPG